MQETLGIIVFEQMQQSEINSKSLEEIWSFINFNRNLPEINENSLLKGRKYSLFFGFCIIKKVFKVIFIFKPILWEVA